MYTPLCRTPALFDVALNGALEWLAVALVRLRKIIEQERYRGNGGVQKNKKSYCRGVRDASFKKRVVKVSFVCGKGAFSVQETAHDRKRGIERGYHEKESRFKTVCVFLCTPKRKNCDCKAEKLRARVTHKGPRAVSVVRNKADDRRA